VLSVAGCTEGITGGCRLAHDDAIADAQHNHGARHLSVAICAHDGADGVGGWLGDAAKGAVGGAAGKGRGAAQRRQSGRSDRQRKSRSAQPPWPWSQGLGLDVIGR
jgi:hypothetical protein